ncbi:putative conjugative transfer protein TraA [Orientia tsutsugamushi str. UT144]|uniref:Putative conjugative transfer protein TraA n=1 Tax=Orientia tsutsugamushi str. UT144 TaxID=1441384 RepID=A0A0F3RJH0_ORITS|nr:putative conjugative transfer protein TraA [Orientia tsutsugamushi str. UT144]
MLKNKGATAVKELMIPEIMKLINTQNVKTEPEQVVKTDIAPKIGLGDSSYDRKLNVSYSFTEQITK